MLGWRLDRLAVAAPLLAAMAFPGCSSDDGPLGPEGRGPAPVVDLEAVLNCQADIRAGELSCDSAGPELAAGVSGAIVGNQDYYVRLTSSNVAYDSGNLTFRADVTIQNRLVQPMGTLDGVTQDADGIRIFFVQDPMVTAGSGAVSLINEDGAATFSGSDRDYFQYDELLHPGQTSAARVWEWSVPSTVDRFEFQVAVSAALFNEAEIEAGWGLDAGSFATGLSHTCALSYRGELLCWGDGSKGQFANGRDHSDPESESGVPQLTAWSGEPLATIASFADQVCGLTTSGKAYCWGDAEDGSHGDAAGSRYASLPIEVDAGATRFRDIAVGGDIVCATSTEGSTFCWGDGANGALGNGANDFSPAPVEVVTGEEFVTVSASMGHLCALNSAGKAFCWGSNEFGELGDGSHDQSAVPVEVNTTESFTSLSLGGLHSCALNAEGEAFCWGNGRYGQLGAGNRDNSAAPVRVEWDGAPFVSISAGGAHTCAVTEDGGVYCWGSAVAGVLGNGAQVNIDLDDGSPVESDDDQLLPTPITAPGTEHFVSVGLGLFRSCATTLSGQSYCWGFGETGALGDGQWQDSSLPVRVELPPFDLE